MAHPWLTSQSFNVNAENAKVFARLKNFGAPKRLKMETLMMLVNLIDEQQLQENKRAFQCIDTDHSGTMSQQEMLEAIRQIN